VEATMGTKRLVAVTLTAFLVLVGCGDRPDPMEGAPPPPANIGGSWSYMASNVSGSGVSCSTPTPAQLTLSQVGSTFTGSYSNLYIRCQSGTESAEDGPFQGQIVSGSINGGNTSFNFDTSDISHTGSLSGNSMSGTTTWRFDLGTQVVTLTGNWSASR
jgi:hypothetical protein